MHWYHAYGLKFASDLPLPELDPAEPGTTDVRVVLRPVPERLAEPAAERSAWSAAADEWLLTAEGVGRFHVSGGSEIAIERWGTDQQVRAFLFGSTMGALLHQRRYLTLHASSVLHGSTALLIAGNSGVGKSTTLAALTDRGHRMIADDKTVLYLEEGRLVTVPGYPTVRLWRDALEAAGRDAVGLDKVDENYDKHLWRAPELHDASAEIGGVFLLRKARVDDVAVHRVDGIAAFRRILAATYRRRMVRGLGVQDTHFELAATLAGQVPVHVVLRPPERDTVTAVVETILATAGAPHRDVGDVVVSPPIDRE